MPAVKQVVTIVAGLVFGVLGGITLARTGVGDLDRHTTAVGLHHTTLLAYVEIAYGVLLLVVGGLYSAERASLLAFGTVALGFGIVVVAAHRPLHDVLGVHVANGVLYIIAGAVLLLTGLLPDTDGGVAPRRETSPP